VRALRNVSGCQGCACCNSASVATPARTSIVPTTIPGIVVYTGTHDNNTSVGWLHAMKQLESRDDLEPMQAERTAALKYSSMDRSAWDMIRLALASVGHLAIVPLQRCVGPRAEAA
jgi:4-alpha-glucanotransferase